MKRIVVILFVFVLVILAWLGVSKFNRDAAGADVTPRAASTQPVVPAAPVDPEQVAREAEARRIAAINQEGLDAVAEEDWPTALAKLEEALEEAPSNLRYGTDYRQAVIAAGEYDRCFAFFEKLILEHPEEASLYLNFGMAHVDKIPIEGAITQVLLANKALGHFTTSIELEETWLARYTRGNSYLFWPPIFGRTELGMTDLRRAIEMAAESKGDGPEPPYHAHAHAALGDGFWRLEDVETARKTWQQGLEMFPGDSDLTERLALEGEALDTYLDKRFEGGNRVDTTLAEIWAADEAPAPVKR